MTTIEYSVRRWQDEFGNTYHTVKMHAEGTRHGKHPGGVVSPVTYGYGTAYEQTALDMAWGLEPWIDTLEEFREAATCTEVVDVKRKRDLHSRRIEGVKPGDYINLVNNELQSHTYRIDQQLSARIVKATGPCVELPTLHGPFITDQYRINLYTGEVKAIR